MKYQTIKCNMHSGRMLEQLSKGAFFTTKVKDKVNTMTIGWGGINILWGKLVFVAYVRFSRETYQMIEESNEFTISVPLDKDMKKELAYCGTKSRRDTDKIKDMNLKLTPGRVVETPILSDCELHYECKVIYGIPMEQRMIPKDVKFKYYPKEDYHMIYYGEVVDSYLIEGEE